MLVTDVGAEKCRRWLLDYILNILMTSKKIMAIPEFVLRAISFPKNQESFSCQREEVVFDMEDHTSVHLFLSFLGLIFLLLDQKIVSL